MSRRAVIVGAYNTKQARELLGEDSESVTLDAAEGALADAGLGHGALDGLNVVPGFDSLNGSRSFGYSMGLPFFWVGRAALGPAAVFEAAMAIEAGQCDVALLASGQAGLHRDHGSVAPWTRPSNEFIECWGLMTPAEFALTAQEYLTRFSVDPTTLAYIASVIRNNGSRNPEAVYYGRGPYAPSDILASRMIADPYHLLDCSMTSEGGSALVITTEDRARDLPGVAVSILGGGAETWGPSYTHPPTYERVGLLGRRAADRAFARAGIARDDVDVFELYDNFSWEIIRYFEAFRYCDIGQGAEFVADGAIEVGGSHPIVTDGGTMSHSHTGESQRLQRVVQAVRQLRGTSAANQVSDARIALVAQLGDVLLLGALTHSPDTPVHGGPMTDAIAGIDELDADVAAWLERFRKASGDVGIDPDVDALRDCFADVFLSGDASGGRPVPLETFLAVLPNRVRAAAAAGVGRAVLRSASASALDEYWVLLRTAWAAPRSDGGELAMASSFLLHRSDSGMRATVYLNHEGLPRSLGA